MKTDMKSITTPLEALSHRDFENYRSMRELKDAAMKLAAHIIQRETPVVPEYIGQFDWWACPSCCSTVCTKEGVALFCAGCGSPLIWSKA